MLTGMFGAFLGDALQTRRKWLRVLAPIFGLVLAIAAHTVNDALPLIAAITSVAGCGGRFPDVTRTLSEGTGCFYG
jgi:hypothetical protein